MINKRTNMLPHDAKEPIMLLGSSISTGAFRKENWQEQH
jgi:hypothetical protein